MNIPNNRSITNRVYVDSPTGTVEITDRVRRGSVTLGDVTGAGTGNAGVDAVVMTLTLELDGSSPRVAPLTDSPMNDPSDLLRPYQPVRVVATVDGVDTTIFSGFLGDELRSDATPGAHGVTVTARDLAKPLQDTFLDEFPILAATATDATPVGVVSILNELLALIPAHVRPTLTVVGSPDFEVRAPYRPQRCTVWDAAQQLVAQTGWHLGVRGGTLTLLDPPRTKLTADWLIDRDDLFADSLGISDADIRNVINVVWTDAATRERRTTTKRDQGSIDNLTGGVERASTITLDDTSQIDTLAEAEALADRFLHDMSREFAATRITLPFLPDLRLFDTLGVANPAFTADQRIAAVVSVRHDFAPGQARTVIVGTGQVVGRRRAWLDGEPRPGSPSDPRGPHQALLPPPLVTITAGNPGIVVRVDERRGVDAVGVEVHWSLVNGFTPSPATLKARGAQEVWTFATTDVAAPDYVIPGVTHYVRVRAYDSQGNGGEWTAQVAVTPAKVDPAAIILDSDVEINGDLDITGKGNTGTLRFWKPGPPESLVLALGNVGGLFGAPAGSVGLAGGLGAGVWLTDSLQVMDAGWNNALLDFGSPATNAIVTRTDAHLIRGAGTIPAGEAWVIVAVPNNVVRIGTRYGRVLGQQVAGFVNPSGGGVLSTPVMSGPQAINNVSVSLSLTLEAVGTAATLEYLVEYVWLLLRRTLP